MWLEGQLLCRAQANKLPDSMDADEPIIWPVNSKLTCSKRDNRWATYRLCLASSCCEFYKTSFLLPTFEFCLCASSPGLFWIRSIKWVVIAAVVTDLTTAVLRCWRWARLYRGCTTASTVALSRSSSTSSQYLYSALSALSSQCGTSLPSRNIALFVQVNSVFSLDVSVWQNFAFCWFLIACGSHCGSHRA